MTKGRAKPLEHALTAVRANKHADALPHLLAAWRSEPSAPLAEVIGHVSAKSRKDPQNLRGKTAAALEAWTALAKRAPQSAIPALLDSLADASSKDAIARLAIVATWMPDPRVDDALVRLLETVPYRATSTKPFWNVLFSLAAQITDPRQIARLQGCDADGVAATMREWLRAQIAKLVAGLPPRDAPASPLIDSPGSAGARSDAKRRGEMIEELAALLGPRKLSVRTQNVEALLQAVYDAPDDDAPRTVYADALLERGDPRGELIALQLAPQREQKKREKELLALHGKQWLGELAPVIMAGYRFERGFLVECKVDNRHLDRVRKVVGHPVWSTVKTISGSAAIALHPVMRSLRELAFVSYEARNHEELPDSWRDLLLATERPIESLRYSGIASDRAFEDALERNESVRPGVQGRWVHVPQVAELDALCKCSALPKLRELIVVEDPELVAEPLLGSPVIRRLAVFGVVFDARSQRGNPLRWFERALRDAPVATLRFELGSFHQTHVEVARGATGYERLAMTVGPTMRSNWSHQLVNEAIDILDAMPPSLRELRITLRRNTEAQQAARLRAAAAQKRLDVCEIA